MTMIKMTVNTATLGALLGFLLVLVVSGTSFGRPPVRIIAFTAKYAPESKAVNLHWVTAGEKQQVQFIIERSLDSVHFKMIGETRSSGNSDEQQHYYFSDSRPGSGTLYYRIREIDKKGMQFVTGPSMVQVPIAGMELAQLLLSHNGKELNFAIVSPDSTSASNVLVSDVAGKIKASFVLKLKRGANMHSIYTGDLPPGVYFLQVNDPESGRSVMQKFIKQANQPVLKDSTRQ